MENTKILVVFDKTCNELSLAEHLSLSLYEQSETSKRPLSNETSAAHFCQSVLLLYRGEATDLPSSHSVTAEKFEKIPLRRSAAKIHWVKISTSSFF